MVLRQLFILRRPQRVFRRHGDGGIVGEPAEFGIVGLRLERTGGREEDDRGRRRVFGFTVAVHRQIVETRAFQIDRAGKSLGFNIDAGGVFDEVGAIAQILRCGGDGERVGLGGLFFGLLRQILGLQRFLMRFDVEILKTEEDGQGQNAGEEDIVVHFGQSCG